MDGMQGNVFFLLPAVRWMVQTRPDCVIAVPAVAIWFVHVPRWWEAMARLANTKDASNRGIFIFDGVVEMSKIFDFSKVHR